MATSSIVPRRGLIFVGARFSGGACELARYTASAVISGIASFAREHWNNLVELENH